MESGTQLGTEVVLRREDNITMDLTEGEWEGVVDWINLAQGGDHR
jgi:hypothetical protein